MLALIYFGLAICLGDFLCRRFYQFVSIAHRLAAAVLVGLLVSSWFTYLAGLAFAWASRPLLWGNLLFFIAAVALLSWPRWKGALRASALGRSDSRAANLYLPRAEGSTIADWLLIAGYVALVSWMMFASFNSTGTKLQISNPQYSDFGPNTAIMQSFAVGHNFPTEYPHFSGDRIRYHFLFYFQAGNLEFLGLDPAWSLNLLSITTLVAMLVLVMVLGQVLFDSRVVGRLGSFLFFFFGSLSYIPFLQKQISVRAALQAIMHQREYLPTVFPYRGELWGTWSQVTYLNQRHFASAIGILLLVLVFLVIHYRTLPVKQTKAPTSLNPVTSDPHAVLETASDIASNDATQPEQLPEAAAEMLSGSVAIEATQPAVSASETFRATLPGFVFSGVLLGLLPMWNSAVFIGAAAVLAVLLILFPLRLQMLALGVAAGMIALPQLIYLSIDGVHTPKLLHWGFTLPDPTMWNVTKYLAFTFGYKWLLIALALVFATGL